MKNKIKFLFQTVTGPALNSYVEVDGVEYTFTQVYDTNGYPISHELRNDKKELVKDVDLFEKIKLYFDLNMHVEF